MATGEDIDFNTACFRERFTAQMLLGEARDAVAALAAETDSQRVCCEEEGLGGENLVRRNVEKRGLCLMNIDLNVAPPEDADCELSFAEGSRNVLEIRSPAADVAPDVSASEAVLFDEREASSDLIAEQVSAEIRVDSEEETVEKSRRKKRWFALLEFAENALVEKEEENRKRRASQESELSGEPPTRRKIGGQRRQSLEDGGNEVATVVRSSRGRTVAMPNKYRDSVLGAVAIAEAELPRRNKSGKSATVFSTKRKSR